MTSSLHHIMQAWVRAISRLLVFLALVATSQEGLRLYLGTLLRKQLQEPLPPGYVLDFQHSRINWREQALEVRALTLQPPALTTALRPQIRVDLPHLRVALNAIFPSLRHRQLYIKSIQIDQPAIQLATFQQESGNFTQSSLAILDSLSHYLSLLKIQNLNVHQARLDFTRWQDSTAQQLQLSEINLSMSGFSIDSSLRRHSFLNAEEVNLEIIGQRLLLPQKDHELCFDTLQLSTHKGQILFSGLNLSPSQPVDETAPQLNIKSPSVRLQDIDFAASYLKKELVIGQVDIQSPQIDFSQQQLQQDTQALRPLKEAIGQLAQSVRINTLRLQQANIDLSLHDHPQEAVQFNIDSILIQDFAVDINTSFSDIEHLPFSDVQIYLSHIRQYLSPQLGQLRIDKARLHSERQQIQLEGLQIGDPQLQNQNFFQAIPLIQLDGINIFDVLLHKNAWVKRINCFQPTTRFLPQSEQMLSKSKQNFSQTLSSFFTDFFLQEITCDELLIKNGQIVVPGLIEVPRYQYAGQNIRLDNTAASWNHIIPTFECQASHFQFQLDTTQSLHGDSVYINQQWAQVLGLAFRQNQSHQQTVAQVQSLTLSQLSIDSLLAGKLYADSLIIDTPQLFYRQDSSIENAKPQPVIHIPFGIIRDGKLDYQSPGTGALMVNNLDAVFGLEDSLQLLFSRFSELSLTPRQGAQQLFIQRGQQLDTTLSYELSGLQLVPKAGGSDQDSSLFVPNLRIYGWNPQDWFQDSLLTVRKLILEQPRYALQLSDSPALPGSTDQRISLQLDTLLLFNAQLDVSRESKGQYWKFPSITMALYQLQLPARGHLLSSWQSMLLGLDQGLYFRHPDYELRTAPVFYNSTLNQIQTDSIHYQSRHPYGLTGATLINSQIKGLDLEQALDDKQWYISALDIDSAAIAYTQTPDTLQREQAPFQWPRLYIRQLRLGGGAELHIQPSIEIKGLNVEADGLKIDSTWQSSLPDQAWQTLAASVETVRFSPDREQDYQLQFGLDYQSDDNRLQILAPQLHRNLSTTAFVQKQTYRKDYWQLAAERLVAYDFDPRMLWADSLRLSRIQLDQLNAQIFNNARIPVRDAYRPLLPDQIKALPFPFLIDTLSVNGALEYQTIAALTGDSSWISFDEVNGTLYHITNIPRLFGQPMQLNATAQLYNHAPLRVKMTFDLHQDPSIFELSGALGYLDLQRLNPILRAQTAMAVVDGQSTGLLFNLAANDSLAVGELLFRYNRLRIQLLDKENLSTRSGFLSFWTNRLIQSSNPSWLSRRKGTIFFQRDQQKAIAHYWVNSILSGVVSSIGVKNTRRRLRRARIDIADFSYETLLKAQLKDQNKQENN